MRFAIILLILSSLICFVRSSPVDVTEASEDGGDKSTVQANCNFKCTRERQPICATSLDKRDYQIFDNFCELLLFNCNTKDEYRKVDMEQCYSKNGKLEKRKIITSRLIAK